MNFEYSPYILPLLAAAFVSAFVAIYAWTRRTASGAFALFFMAITIFEWSVAYVFEIAGANLETKYFFGVIQYFAIAFMPYIWLWFAIVYGDVQKFNMRRYIILTALLPAITVVLALTTKWNHLIWQEYSIIRQGAFSAIVPTYGYWFWIHFGYSYLMLLVGTILLVRTLFVRKGMYRGQVVLLLVAVIVPWIANIVTIFKLLPMIVVDLTPFAFTVTVTALAWAIFGFHLVDITPLARDRVVDSMREGMVVLDARGNVVDINNAAARMIGVPVGNAIGKTAADIFSPWAELVERFRTATEALEQISVGEGEARRYYEVRLSPLQDQQGQPVGRIIMLRAMDNEIPLPRFAHSAAFPSDTQPLPDLKIGEGDLEEHAIGKRIPILGALINFYYAPIKKDLPVPPNINPVWHRTRERIFTMILRFAATLRTVILLAAVATTRRFGSTDFMLAVIIFALWVLGAARSIKYELRAGVFLFLVYSLGFMEILRFGFSVQSFIFFMTFIIISAILVTRRGAFHALASGLVTMCGFALLINFKIFVPFALGNGEVSSYLPNAGVVNLLVFTASSSIILMFLVTILENLNNAWQKEAQALNLLQQERDLLEQRVAERTYDLAEARDSAIRSSTELRKYYRAIEQSGSSVVITDAAGNIEYANPKFEEVSGYALEEVIGKTPRVLKSGRQRPEFYDKLWKTISSGQIWNGIFHNRKKDGSLFWESATIAPVMDQNGAVINYVAIKEDISTRREVEEQLRKLSQAVEQSGNTVVIMNQRGLIEYVNPKFTEVTGYSPEEAIGKATAELMQGLDAPPDFRNDAWWKTVNAGLIWRGEFQNHRKDGSVFWESATIAPVQDNNGEIINFVEIKQDITEEKVLQEQLQRQNDYLSILHQLTLDLLNRREINDLLQVVVDRSTVLMDASFCELRLEKDGYLVAEAFIGDQPNLKGDRATREQAVLSWQAYDTHQPVVIEDYATSKFRREIYTVQTWRATVVLPIMAGERCLGTLALGRVQPGYKFTAEQIETGILFARLVALVLDNANLYDSAMREIAERKHAEALLQESEVRFRQIVENAGDIIYRTDMNGNFTYVNPTGLHIMGCADESELVGRHYLDMVIPPMRHKLKRAIEYQLMSRTMNSYQEFIAVTTDGREVWIGQSVQLIMDGGELVGCQAVARDITQLKQAQDALSLSRDQALDASRFKSQLLSRVSHELRTPLGGILGYAELLQYKAFGSLSEKQENAVNNIIESTHYLTNIVNDLLDEAQIESRSLSLHYEHFSPLELLDRIKTTMSVLAGRKGLTFHAEISPDLPGELYGDVNRLQQIIINLAGNAVKFTASGEVSVTVRCPTPAQWSIEVRDTGAGIPVEEQKNIFEPFRQVNNAITRENRGSGLGLAITKQIVELMGGHISLESEIGKGSIFTITLPITNASEDK
jgi:PAS domain S-box-containing protein